MFPVTDQEADCIRVNAFMWGAMVNMLFKLKISDVDSAFSSKKNVDNITLTAEGALIDTEILAKARSKDIYLRVGVSRIPGRPGARR